MLTNDQCKHYECVEIGVPEWFKNRQFLKWLNSHRNIADHPKPDPEGPVIASWHKYGKAEDYSDIFMTYDRGDGSDMLDMPVRFQKELRELLGERYCVVRLVNYEIGGEAPGA